MFYKKTQVGRSLRKSNLEFKKRLFEADMELADKADQDTLKNKDIPSKRKFSKSAKKPMFQ